MDTMLEKDSWPCTPEGVFPVSCDCESIKEATSTVSDQSGIPGNCFKNSNADSISTEFCEDDPIIGDKCAAVDSSSYLYSLSSHVTQTDNDLNFLVNDCGDGESNDLLYYGWPDIGSFEDVDRMFRNCDSTFGLQDVGNEDDFGWFSSSHAIEGSEDVSKSQDFKFSYPESSLLKNMPEQTSKLIDGSPPINDSNIESSSVSYESHPGTVKDDESANLGHFPCEVVSSTSSKIKDGFLPNEQSVEAPVITTDEKRAKLHFRQGFKPPLSSNKHEDLRVQAVMCNPISFQKQVHHSGNGAENPSEVGISVVIPPELDFSNIRESSCMSSGVDEISLEATSFHQLQHIMEQLDIRTKLCIRDSLYRLARSAEQRHNCANVSSGSRDDRRASGVLTDEETNKCSGFMDMETDTNPIDRSIAHLLFHKPPDSSVTPAYYDAVSNKSNMIHGSIASPPVKAGKLFRLEETEADEKVPSH